MNFKKKKSEMVKEKGFITVLLARLAIFPPNIVNYAFSLTSISFITYIIATILGLLPGIVVLSFVGASIRKCSCDEEPDWVKIIFWVTLGFTVVFSVVLAIWARNAIRNYKLKNLNNSEDEQEEEKEKLLN